MFLIVLSLLGGQTAVAQETGKRVTLDMTGVTMKAFVGELQRQTGYAFFYKEDVPGLVEPVTVQATDEPLEAVLQKVLGAKGCTFTLEGETVVIRKRVEQRQQTVEERKVAGVVKDEAGNPLPGVTILLKGTTVGTATDIDGKYALTLPAGDYTLLFSMIGMKTQEVKVGKRTEIDVVLEADMSKLEDVVVTGMFVRRAESFTGSAETFEKEDILRAGNQNILTSLKNLDPSFQIVESMEFGSDPNRTPEIQLRGKTSFPNLQGEYEGNPNQPLFILDGFETSVDKVYDLDMNRVVSVTLLKDAAAKAIYGSKAGNGVVVIETMRPRMGELMVSYVGDLNLEVPDLTGYNLMNAEEKLRYEVSRGMYSAGSDAATKQEFQELYQTNYQSVLRGVDTYWLSKPLRVGVGHKHSLTLEGGDARMRYAAGISYNGIAGVMKGSDRKTYSFYTTLSYSYKGLIFRNTLEYSRNAANDSPYGSFSEYAALNPYWIPYDETGKPVKLLGVYGDEEFYNPLYNASLNTKFYSNYDEIRDNFSAEWKINNSLKATGRFSFTRQLNGAERFYPASHTRFVDYDENGMSEQKGNYTKEDGSTQSFQMDAGINYNYLKNKHMLYANATWNISTSRSRSNSYVAEGFGNDQMDDISFATSYEKDGSPSGSTAQTREIGVIGSANYSFDDRYLFDASIRMTGSSVYGADNRWGTFWAFGVGWNIHHEPFAEVADWLTQLKLRASVGYTGTQNFSPFQAKARYSYSQEIYDGKLGANLIGLPNSNLKWQRNMDYNVGVDLNIRQFLTLRLDCYISQTNDLLSDITAAPSMGFDTYRENLGKIENRGIDLALSITPWRNSKKDGWVTLSVSALSNKNEIKQIYDIFKSSNDRQNSNKDNGNSQGAVEDLTEQYTNPSTLYYEGQSMTAIWGVRSAGIDPLTGQEVFYDKENNKTYTWSSLNQVVIGDTNPKVSGNISLNAGYKGFTLSLSCSYKWGGEMYNSTLISKVENATGRENLDRRIFDSWNEVGQLAPYKVSTISAANPSPDYTRPTSRFVQKDNELYVSTLNLGYNIYNLPILKKLGMRSLRFSFYMNELLRLSSIEIERGTSYPFARNFSFSMQVSF